MRKMWELIRKALQSDSGQSTAEYAVIVGVVLAVAIGIFWAIGQNARAKLTQTNDCIQNPATCP